MLKAYKYRIYPNKSQQILLAKTFGCVRYFWNKQVETFNSYDKELNPNPIFLTSTQIRKEVEFFQEVSAAAIQQKEIDFKEYKSQRFNKSRKTTVGNTSFKNKHKKQSYRLPNQKFSLKNNKIRLEKIGLITVVIDRQIPKKAKLMSVTISKNPNGQHFASVLAEHTIEHLPKTNKEVGLDVGLKEFLVQSDNIIVKNPRYFRDSQTKLAKIQKQHSKKKKGGKRRNKSRLKVARIHNKIANQRDWFLHNESTRIIKNYDVICVEDLNVSGMIKNHCLSKSIADASWSKFYSMLEYKANWYGKEIVKIGRFEPTSKTCSCCGWINKVLTLKDRTFACPVCGLELDRDLNAAINIKALGVDNAIRTSSMAVTPCNEMSKI
jgi:putative transposase